MSEIFSIKLVTPSKVFLEANASLVTVPATEGDIGFLANHVNFISSIRPGFISVNLESGDEKVIYISEGFAQFNDNSLLIIAVELIEKEDLNSDFVNQKIIDLQNMQDSNISNIKLQSKIDSLKSLSL
ncbi:MAG: FoF1 ATP synthase subunit delta/epsilon [Candidatus Pelagibacterales bacterium]|jgi:F-type H+-transporting ATPase subunit epsilon|nr:F0F1 ATP synthase subunit epsilon [Pelagibacterales bacterium]|tara:strand:- start:1165 stop:1548 length:384 start_codon:yes stop_codon:yes gene_type:complete